MSEFGGLWTHKNNSTKCVSLQSVKAGHYRLTEEDFSKISNHEMCLFVFLKKGGGKGKNTASSVH